jgi:hypothetical protein
VRRSLLVFGLWSLVFGLWSLFFGLWSLVFVRSQSPVGSHHPAMISVGSCDFVDSLWNLQMETIHEITRTNANE